MSKVRALTTNTLMKSSLSAVAGIVALLGLNAPVMAQLASQESTFTGTVPAVCTVSDQVQATTPMSLNGGGTELAGLTDDFNFISNGAVSVQLRAVNVTAQPAGTNSYKFDGSLNDSNTEIATATANNSSAAVPYPSGLVGNEDFSMGLVISVPNGSVLTQGQYTAVLTTDCIAS